MPRYFTYAQAQAVLPHVESLIRAAVTAKAAYEQAESEMTEISRKIVMTGGMAISQEKVADIKNSREESAAKLTDAFEKLQAYGCLVKDLDTGLLDFPTLYHGREVYLCWRLGEPRIEYWHAIEDGFRGRKEIDGEFLEHHASG